MQCKNYAEITQCNKKPQSPISPDLNFTNEQHRQCLFSSSCRTSTTGLILEQPEVTIDLITLMRNIILKSRFTRDQKELIIQEINQVVGDKPIEINLDDLKDLTMVEIAETVVSDKTEDSTF